MKCNEIGAITNLITNTKKYNFITFYFILWITQNVSCSVACVFPVLFLIVLCPCGFLCFASVFFPALFAAP